MNSLTDFICDNIENFCFELVFNQSSNEQISSDTEYFRLSQNSSSYWIKIFILFIYLSLNILLDILKRIFSMNYSNEKYYEILDLTNDDDYQSYLNQEFHLTIEQRSSIKIL